MKVFLDANICLDLLDSRRQNSPRSVAWYMENKNTPTWDFYFSGDFITTFYYILTEKQKLKSHLVIEAIHQLCVEITPIYLVHQDFLLARQSFFAGILHDFEDLIILQSVLRTSCDQFITHDRKLLEIKTLDTVTILSP